MAEGRFGADDLVLSFFPDAAPAEIGPNLAAMRVRHLLSMSTGHDEDALGFLDRENEDDWARTFLARPVPLTPGSTFCYDSVATYMVSAIVQQTTGQTVLDYLTSRVFEPLGITGAHWDCCPRGINTGGWGLNLRTEDIARFGQLYLRDGVWNGRRLLPVGWVAEATRAHVSNGDDANSDWAQGYGYQFWRCRHGHYRGDGAFGQYCVVLPSEDAVVAITSGQGDMQSILDRLWEGLLPAFKPAPRPPDAAGEAALRDRLTRLRVPTPQGATSSTAADGRTFRLAANDQGLEAVRFDFAAGRLALRDASGERSFAFGGPGEWVTGLCGWDGPVALPLAASGAWTAPDTFTLGLSFTRTPFCPTVTFQFQGDGLTLTYRANVGFGPTDRAPIAGIAE
jgi:hypothetical protein